MTARISFLGALMVLLTLVSCAGDAPPSERPAQTVRFFMETFGDAPDHPGSGSMFTGVFTTALLRVASSVNVRYEQTLEKELAEAVISGQVTAWQDGSWTKQATVGFDARCVDPETGVIRWSVSDVSRPFASAVENRTAQYVSRAAATHGLKQIRDQL
jgi:hypothetical protein